MAVCGTLVNVDTCLPVVCQIVARDTGTRKTPFCILAVELAWTWRFTTFIYITTAAARGVDTVTIVTQAAVRPHRVDTATVLTGIWHAAAFIDV